MADPTPQPKSSPLLAIELGLVVLAALGSLAYDLTLPGRLPHVRDQQAAADAILANVATGDAVAVLPTWAERVRGMVPGVPFISAPDLATADLSRVKRLWLVELPSLPRGEVPNREREATARLKEDGAVQSFGNVLLKRYVNPDFHEPLFDFTRDLGRAHVWIDLQGRQMDCTLDGTTHRCGRAGNVAHEVREIDFAPYDCVGANPVGHNYPLIVDYPEATLGSKLHVMAAVTGEMGWRHGEGRTPVDFTVDIDGQRMGEIHIPVGTVPPQRSEIDTSKLDPKIPHDVRFSVVTENPKDREFCFDASSD
ncbi:MAG: hypothetical protein JST54_10460 [Deltaproteobacteria bacterium]|nr:hypothetical protein [Deltaproteobacteria bacterium]